MTQIAFRRRASDHLPANHRKLQLLAFQRAAARRAITQMDGWSAVPEFVAALSELDSQIAWFCNYANITKDQFYSNWINYLKAKPLEAA